MANRKINLFTSSGPRGQPLSAVSDGASVPFNRGDSATRELGQREREVMAVILDQGSANVQQVAALLTTPLAYTTVMTTLDRLFKKGLLHREKQDRAFVYSASLTAREIEERRAKGLIQRFFTGSAQRPELLLSCLVDAVHSYDTRMLDELEKKIRVAKQKLQENSAKQSGKC